MQLSDPLTLLAVIGLTAFALASYFNYKVYRRLKNEGETTIEYLLIRSEIKKALELLVASILIFLLSTLVTVLAIETERILLSQIIRAGSAVMFISYTGFFAVLAIYTRPEKLGGLT